MLPALHRLGRVACHLTAARGLATSVKRLIILGGVAGGASAAARARRLSEHTEISVFEKGPAVSFANCGLPYHIGGTISNREALQLHTPQSLAAQLNINVHTNTEVTAIDPEARTIQVKDVMSGETRPVPYDKLILAPGASPIRPPLPGMNHPRVVTLRTLADMDSIKQQMTRARDITVIGAGFIGLEMAEQLTEAGKKVTVVELQPQVLPQVDADMARSLQAEMQNHGVDIIVKDGVKSIQHFDTNCELLLNSGKKLRSELVILSVGVRPDSGVARQAKLALTPSGHIIVNEWQQTSNSDIYAVGDAVETADAIMPGQRAKVALGGPANRQGRVAADHIFLQSKAKPYPGSLGTAIVRAFSCVVACVGWSSAALRRANVPFCTTVVHENDHAGYYPGATPLTLKLMWSPKDGRIFGAQAYGQNGVDKRMDVLATAIRGRMTIDDLVHLELAYAPPFNGAKDPVNVLGYVATNERDKLLRSTGDLAAFVSDKQGAVTVVDVRPPHLVAAEPMVQLPGTKLVTIPLLTLRKGLRSLDPKEHIVTCCVRGRTSYMAARVLEQHGFNNVTSLSGGSSFHPELLGST